MTRTSRTILPFITVILLLMMPLAVHADGGDDGFTQTVNGYEVALTFAEDPAVGENQIQIQVSDTSDLPVSDAQVKVSLAAEQAEHEMDSPQVSSHDNMPGMDMSDPTAAHEDSTHEELQPVILEASHHEQGKYSGEIHIESSGDWVIRVHLTIERESMEVSFPLMVKSGSRSGILAGFAGINILILIVAAMKKSTSVSKAL